MTSRARTTSGTQATSARCVHVLLSGCSLPRSELTPPSSRSQGFFLAFLSRHFSNPHLVPQLNAALRHSTWDDGEHLRTLLGGKDVDELWEVYKRSVGKKDGDEGEAPAPVPTHGPRSGYSVQY